MNGNDPLSFNFAESLTALRESNTYFDALMRTQIQNHVEKWQPANRVECFDPVSPHGGLRVKQTTGR